MHMLAAVLLAVVLVSDPFGSQQPEDDQPLTSTPQALADTWGDERFLDVDDPTQGSDLGLYTAGIGTQVQQLSTAGLVNGDFRQGPPNADAHIDDANRLPGWTYTVVQGGRITLDWVADSSAPGGYAIRATTSASAANDEVYLEQIVPVSPRMMVRAPEITVGAATGLSGDIRWTFKTQYLKADGSTTGSGNADNFLTWDLGADTYQLVHAVPSDAAYLRIRVGVIVDVAASDVASLREVWAGEPVITWVTISGSDITLPATGSAAIAIESSAAAGAARYIPPADGFVAAISVKTSAVVTGAAIDFNVYNVDGAATVGPTATISAGGLYDGAYATGVYAAANTFLRDNELRFRANVPSGTLTSTTADVVVVATLGLFIFKATSGLDL